MNFILLRIPYRLPDTSIVYIYNIHVIRCTCRHICILNKDNKQYTHIYNTVLTDVGLVNINGQFVTHKLNNIYFILSSSIASTDNMPMYGHIRYIYACMYMHACAILS